MFESHSFPPPRLDIGTRRATRLAIAAMVLLAGSWLAAAPAAAQPFFPGTVAPQPGSPFAPLTATLAVPGCLVSGPQHSGSELTRNGQVLSLTVETLSSFPCFAAGDPRTEVPGEFNLGNLESGRYTLQHFRQIDGGTPVLQETLSFEVGGDICRRSSRPGATVVVPYFEVDLANVGGRTTAISLNNASDEPAMARVILWSDWGVPVLGFNLYLKANDVQAFNLRQILEGGALPTTGADLDPGVFDGCSAPLELPTLDAPALARLRAQLQGLPDPVDGFCYGRDRGDTRAVGFLTADAVTGCSESLQIPTDDGYFAPGGTGLASNRNILWGDIFQVDPDSNSAQGFQALSLQATQRLGPGPTFHGIPGSDRNPLPVTYRTRYLNGGDFQGGGQLQIFTPEFHDPEGLACGAQPGFGTLEVESIDEAGGPLSPPSTLDLDAATQSLDVTDPRLGLTAPFGALEMAFLSQAIILPLPPVDPRTQGFVAPVLTAGDRFSIGLEATPTSTFCDPHPFQ